MGLHGLRALVVDDDEDMSQLLAEALELHGLRVSRRASAEEAMAALSDADAVIADANLGGTSGIELCSRIAAERPGLPIIMLSGDRDAKRPALRRGASEFLLKPVDTALLVGALERLLAR